MQFLSRAVWCSGRVLAQLGIGGGFEYELIQEIISLQTRAHEDKAVDDEYKKNKTVAWDKQHKAYRGLAAIHTPFSIFRKNLSLDLT